MSFGNQRRAKPGSVTQNIAWIRLFPFRLLKPCRTPAAVDRVQAGENLNFIFPDYFDLMRQFPPIYPEGPGEVFLH